MSIPRFIIAGFMAGVLLVNSTAATQQPNAEPTLRDVILRLDKALQRLEQLEQRVARIERALAPTRLQPDKHGILRDESGRPIGVWGVDYPAIEASLPRVR